MKFCESWSEIVCENDVLVTWQVTRQRMSRMPQWRWRGVDVSASRHKNYYESVVTSADCSISDSTAPVSAERLVPHRPAQEPHRPLLGTTGAPSSHRRQRIWAPKIRICGRDLLPVAPASHMEVDRELRAPDRAVTGLPISTPKHALMAEAGLPEPSRCHLMTHPGRWPRHRHRHLKGPLITRHGRWPRCNRAAVSPASAAGVSWNAGRQVSRHPWLSSEASAGSHASIEGITVGLTEDALRPRAHTRGGGDTRTRALPIRLGALGRKGPKYGKLRSKSPREPVSRC